MKNMLIVASVVFAAGLVWAAVPQQAQQQPGQDQQDVKAGAMEVTEVDAVAEVVKVNKKNKTVQIKDPQGRKVTLNVPADVYNIDQIKAGSRLNVRYLEALALMISQPGMPAAERQESVRVAPKAGQPSEVVLNTKEVTGTVLEIDKDKRELTIRTPEESRMIVKAAADIQGFDQVKKGDTAVIHYTEAVALAAFPPGQQGMSGSGSSSESSGSTSPSNGSSGSSSPSGSDSSGSGSQTPSSTDSDSQNKSKTYKR